MFLDFEVISEQENSARIAFDETMIIQLNKVNANPFEGETPILSFLMDIDDFTEALMEMEENQIKIVSGPNETDNGESVFIADPSGNILELFYNE
jgi:catechol-2,3-dioxygenase